MADPKNAKQPEAASLVANIASPLAKVDLEAILEHAEKNQSARVLVLPDIVDKNVVLAEVPVGDGQRQIISLKDKLDEFRDRPERRQGNAKLETLQSFIDHVNRFKTPDTAIFATAGENNTHPKLTSVIDYHSAGAEGAANWRKHTGVYLFPLSDEYLKWIARDGKTMSQEEFAAFLEDRVLDVSELPEKVDEKLAEIISKLGGLLAGPAKLMELSRGLQVNVSSTVKGAANIQSGEATIMFVEEHGDQNGKPLKVPSLFLITVPIFRNGPAYRMVVRLRYRVTGGRVNWGYSIYQPERSFDHAFNEAATKAQVDTETPLLFGSPE